MKPLSVSVRIALLFAVWCTGCRTLDGKIRHQVGDSRDELIEEFGQPDREMRLTDGRTVLWFQPWSHKPTDYTTATCLEIFHLDSKGIVTSATTHGCDGFCVGSHCWTFAK